MSIYLSFSFQSCFPHIVNLACKAVLRALTNLDYAREPVNLQEQRSFLDVVDGDPIATIRALIRVVGVLLPASPFFSPGNVDTSFFIAAARIFEDCQNVQ